MGEFRIIQADVLSGLASVADGSVRCCVTSPPYWGLRDYGHEWQIGLEATPDAYVERMVGVFREVRRVLADDGTLWLNLGDSYATGRGGTAMPAETLAGGVGGQGDDDAHRGRLAQVPNTKNPNAPIATYQPHRNAGAIGLKHKDLVGIPWRVAFALQADGWYLRSDIIWAKPNPMPESVTDRPTKSHEYLFLLSKSARYYYDAAAIAEPISADMAWRAERGYTRGGNGKVDASRCDAQTLRGEESKTIVPGTRNRRSVWTVATQPFRGAHFAVMPEALVEPCVLAGSAEGDTVLDPFTGSGTAGVVALRHNRNFVGTEINPAYAKMASNRIYADQPLLNQESEGAEIAED